MKTSIFKFLVLLLVTTLFYACQNSAAKLPSDKLFTEIPTEISGVNFENKILESEKLHYYKYLYIYIGGGVAAADFNNDGLEDLFFTSNIYHNKLFLNKGNFEFEDITIKAGIEKRVGFDVGVSIADVNNDGYPDIYINRAGWFKGEEKLANMLYINNGDLTFSEQASAYGLDDKSRSISSTFFDYDKDGDLDVYIANAPSGYSLSSKILDLEEIQKSPKTAEFKGSDKLYQNDGNGHFTDVSKAAGILPDLGFGLNAQVGDLNDDGWLDVFVSNDFIGPDFAYLNNGDGTFTEGRNEMFKHLSYYSMGSDFGDINNDGLNDLMVLDMSPEDYVRSKTTMSMMSADRFDEMIKKDYHYQYMHNVMQLNNGNGTYSEIANMSGLAKTDWSWSALLADFDLDGFNDVYVTNGIYRDVVDRDMNNKINKFIDDNKDNLVEENFYEFTQMLPQQKLTNYVFRNNGDLSFENKTKEWVSDKETFSNGAVYADLDNDGDLDIVVNNLDENATILRNNTRENSQNKYIQISLEGTGKNKNAVGTIMNLHFDNGEIQTRQLINARGYLSSVSNKIHFGLGAHTSIPKLEVLWPDGSVQVLKNIETNQLLTIVYHPEGQKNRVEKKGLNAEQLFTKEELSFQHVDESFDDYSKQLLLPHKLSQTGPSLAKSDVNGDGLEDVFIGGAHGQAGSILIQDTSGAFAIKKNSIFEKDRDFEDIDARFFDADNDGDQDLYVVSGSYEFDENSELLQDRLYLNNGKGDYKRVTGALPKMISAGSVVRPMDYDADGDVDLFVGGRVIPGRYPYAPESYLLENNKGKFSKVTPEELRAIGMVTDAQWTDIDANGTQDLIVTGEWMGIEVFHNINGVLKHSNAYKTLNNAKGWWNALLIQDIDNDGDQDIVAGNLGLNYKFHASEEKPFHIYTNDFDNNGVEDIMLAKNYKNKQVPVRGKSCTAQQMPYLKERVKTYNDFASRDIGGILGDSFEAALHYEVNEFRSGIFINTDGRFEFVPFMMEVQMSPVTSILLNDFNNDGIEDLVMAGNNHHAEIETTRADAGTGYFLTGSGQGKYTYIPSNESGFFADGDVRKMIVIENEIKTNVIVANNNASHQLFSVKKEVELKGNSLTLN